jgi:hypothetical protein
MKYAAAIAVFRSNKREAHRIRDVELPNAYVGKSPRAGSILYRMSGSPHIMPIADAIESLNAKLRRSTRNRGHFPSAMKLICAIAQDHLKVEDGSTRLAAAKGPVRGRVRR